MTDKLKTIVVWRNDEFLVVAEDLDRFQARQRGRRLKELSLLGLLAERMGFAVDRASTDQPRLVGAGAGLISLASPSVRDGAVKEAQPISDERADAFLDQFISG